MKKLNMMIPLLLALILASASTAFAAADASPSQETPYFCYYYQATPEEEEEPPLLVRICTLEKLTPDQLAALAEKDLPLYAGKRGVRIDTEVPYEMGEITDPAVVETMTRQMNAPAKASETEVLQNAIQELKEKIQALESENRKLAFENGNLKRSLSAAAEN